MLLPPYEGNNEVMDAVFLKADPSSLSAYTLADRGYFSVDFFLYGF